MKLSNNFTLKEAIKTNTGLPNDPDKKAMSFSLLLAIFILQPIRDKFGRYEINSWYRSSRVNRAVGGSSTSQHLEGQAADGYPEEADTFEVYKWIVEKSGLDFGQCIIYPAKGFIHISLPRINKPNKQALICHEGDYLPYSEEKLNEIVGD
jgi:uncharacterized protein YcbK (DUF882 family)